MFDFSQFPILETSRLRLREIVAEDCEAIFAIRSDYEVTKYNIGEAYTDIKEAIALIEQMTFSYDEQEQIRWGITLKSDKSDASVLGMCGFNYWHRVDKRASIGFDLNRNFWKRGIMREALYAMLDFGFEQMQLNRIEADASHENEASIKLLQTLNFEQEGIQREQYFENKQFYDLALFSLLRREWQAR
jgi:RimJ/RimL family protein N-acetyltransferase